MAFPWDVAAFLALFVIVVILLIHRAGSARRAHAQTEMAAEAPHERLLLRFVDDPSGRRVGETMAVDGDDLVVKDASGFLVVAAADVEENGPGLRLKTPLDETEARRKGDAWKERSHKVITYEASELPPEDQKA